jgi:hypothetical protein
MAEKQTFELGLAMAGAISAGAYSAGVLDFLFEALSEWQRAKDSGAEVPHHNVVIKVISGASAGAITGALSVVALRGGLTSPEARKAAGATYPQGCALPKLYRTWVELPRMCGERPEDLAFLSDSDLAGEESVVASLLNCLLLDEIRDDALTLEPAGSATYPFVSQKLHIYMTISNLRGVPYRIAFSGGTFGMQSHGDRVHYVVENLGTAATTSAFADGDPAESLDVAKRPPRKDDPLWRAYTDAALASGAFPVGLVPREVTARANQYAYRKWPIADGSNVLTVSATFPDMWLAGKDDRPFAFFNVDGGLINNEPFEYARYTLMEAPPGRNEWRGEKADRAVIMIDPFPEPPEFLPDGRPARDLASFIGALFPTLKNQARFKPTELVRAAAEEVYSRYLIAPHRTPPTPKDAKEETFAIACGLLGGFGGFLSEKFRAHDFQLGRRNCQRFLRDAFAVPEANEIIADWAVKAWAKPFETVTPAATGGRHVTLIPVLGTAREEVPYPAWPRLSQGELATLRKQIAKRFDLVLPRLLARQSPNKVAWAYLRLGLAVARQSILDCIDGLVLADLVRRDQVEGWEFAGLFRPEQQMDARRVLAELVHPGFDARTVAGLAAATHLAPGAIETILAVFHDAPEEAPFRVVEVASGKEQRAYTLASRRPGWLRRVPGIKRVVGWLLPQSVDAPRETALAIG